MHSNKKPNGWIVCPSQSIPGKFYYFNVATGEAVWCLDENEKNNMKNRPLQKVDYPHCYPEPPSPPEEAQFQQPIQMSPFQERTICNYPQMVPYQNMPKNVCIIPDPNSSYQIQMPYWQNDSNSQNPPMVMIVMNQALRQLGINEPKFRMNHEPWQAWRSPQILSSSPMPSNQTLSSSQMPLSQFYAPNQIVSTSQIPLSQAWNPNQPQKDPKEPDRELFIQTGKTPLCQRFVNYKKPDRINNVGPIGIDLPDGATNMAFRQSQINKCPSQVNQNLNQKVVFQPTFKSMKQVPEKLDSNHNFARCVRTNSGSSQFNPNSNWNQFGQSPNPQLVGHSTVNQQSFGQSSANQQHFGQNSGNQQNFGQNSANAHLEENIEQIDRKQFYNESLKKQWLLGKIRSNKKLNLDVQEKTKDFEQNQQFFMQRQKNEARFRQCKLKDTNFGQDQINEEHFEQNKTNEGPFKQNTRNDTQLEQNKTDDTDFEQITTKDTHFKQITTDDTHFEQITTNDKQFEQNTTDTSQIEQNQISSVIQPFSDRPNQNITEKSTTRRSPKVEFPKSPITYKKVEPNDNAMEITTLTPQNKVTDCESQDIDVYDLDKNDLRRILLKKRKTNNLSNNDDRQTKKIKTYKEVETIVEPKKSVTFSRDVEIFSNSEHDVDTQNSEIKENGITYFVTDANTLLEEYAVLEHFVKSDQKRKLMIPSSVMRDIVCVSRGESRDGSVVTRARRALRRLAAPPPHVDVEPSKPDSVNIWTDDAILNCCIELIDKSLNVTLVTSDTNLQMKAEYMDIIYTTPENIKSGQGKKREVHFDVQNESADEIDADATKKNFRSPNFEPENLINQKQSSVNQENTTKVTAKAGEIETDQTENFQKSPIIPKNPRDPRNYRFHTSNIEKNISNSNEAKNIHNNTPQKNIDAEKQTQPKDFFLKEINNKENSSKVKNDKLEIDGIEKLPQKRPNPFLESAEISKNLPKQRYRIPKIGKQNGGLTTIFEEDKSRKDQQESSKSESVTKKIHSIFHVEYKDQSGKVAEINNKSIFEAEEIKINKNLKEYLKKFYEKHKNMEDVIEIRRNDVACNFTQVLEDCLNEILREKLNTLQEANKPSPPWALPVALQCLLYVYSNHTYIQDTVGVFTSVLNAAGEVAVQDVVKTIGCGIALVKYLMFVIPTAEIIKDTENALNVMMRHLKEDLDVNANAPAPFFAFEDIEKSKTNFVKDRSSVINYLKKHFAEWADYDDSIEDNTSKLDWGKDTDGNGIIVRTSGKNLSMLKLSSSKPMTFQLNSTLNVAETQIEKNDTLNVNKEDNKQDSMEENASNDNFIDLNLTRVIKNDAAKDTQNLDSTQNCNSKNYDIDVYNAILDDNFVDLKMSRVIKNDTAKLNLDTQNLIDKNLVTQQTEPKVIRLFNDIDFTKENINKKISETSIEDDFASHGHSFGTKEHGPKVLRNIKPIKEFEQKIQSQKLNLYTIYEQSESSENCLVIDTDRCDLGSDYNEINDGKHNYDEQNDNNRICVEKNDDKRIHVEKNDKRNHNGQNDSKDIHDEKNDKRNDVTNDETGKIVNLYDIDMFQTNDIDLNTFEANFDGKNEINDNFLDAMNIEGLNYEFATNDDWLNDLMINDDLINDSDHAYYTVDNFLNGLRITFKVLHEFIGNSLRELRNGELSAPKHSAINAAAKDARAHLKTILEKIAGIIKRESSNGTKLKDLTAGASLNCAGDERIHNYMELVTKCYVHARLIYNALQTLLFITNERK